MDKRVVMQIEITEKITCIVISETSINAEISQFHCFLAQLLRFLNNKLCMFDDIFEAIYDLVRIKAGRRQRTGVELPAGVQGLRTKYVMSHDTANTPDFNPMICIVCFAPLSLSSTIPYNNSQSTNCERKSSKYKQWREVFTG